VTAAVLDVEAPVGAWFATEFDPPPAVLELPADVRTGHDPGLRMTDHLVRGRGIVGRFAAPHAMFGLKVRTPDRPLRVSVDLRLDAGAARWWAERTDPATVAGAGRRELPRLALVSSQGRPRAAVLLARPPIGGRAADARTTVEFDLAPDEVPEHGMVIVAVDDVADRLPGWAAGSVCPASVVGLRVDAVRIAPAAGSPDAEGGAPVSSGPVSAGGFVGNPARRDHGPARTPYVVVNPLHSTSPGARASEASASKLSVAPVRVRLRAVDRSARGVRPSAETAWSRSLPGRAVGRFTRLVDRFTAAELRRRGLRALPAVRADRLEARAVSLADGSEVPVTLTADGRELVVTVDPVPDAPVLLGLARVGGRPGRVLACEVVERPTPAEPPAPEPVRPERASGGSGPA
jgi:hypothetical protein